MLRNTVGVILKGSLGADHFFAQRWWFMCTYVECDRWGCAICAQVFALIHVYVFRQVNTVS